MTIAQAIHGCDARRHNGHSLEQKLRWLSWLDGTVSALVLDRYRSEPVAFAPYTLDTPMDTPLLVGAPFEEMYIYWLEAQVCSADGELADYNNAITQYNRLYQSFANAQSRENMIKQTGQRFRF